MNRKLIAFFALGCALIVARILAGCHTLTPSEHATVASDGVKLSACAASAHLCKVAAKYDGDGGPDDYGPCWDGYVRCKVASGFDGGAK